MLRIRRPDRSRHVVAADDVVRGAAVDAAVDRIAAATGRPVSAVRAEAAAALHEMAAGVSAMGTGVWDRFGSFLARAYEIDVGDDDAAGGRLHHLRELGERASLVFLPNHRSYLDPLVLRQVLRRAGLPPNYILGGINLAKWPFSTLGRHAGLVFIRRSSRDDPVYPAMMRLYLARLVEAGAHLEWYFEGGRTRTGKLRPPRMGVLKYLVEALGPDGGLADAGPDVFVVPVAIVYDQQAEVMAISAEEAGGTKRPESLLWLARFAREQSRRRGGVHVRFGEPMSLRAAVKQAGAAGDETTVVPRVAFDIADRINAATPITAAALLTFALLGNGGRALTLAQCGRVLEPFLAYVHRRGLPVTSLGDLTGPQGLRPVLDTLLSAGVVQEYAGGLEPVYSIAPERWHEAAFYRNTVTHFFVSRAVVELAVVKAAEQPGGDVGASSWAEVLRLRDTLKYEFFFPTRRRFAALTREEAELARPGWRDERLTAAALSEAIASSGMLIAHRIVGPYLEAYLVLADLLAALPATRPVDEAGLVTRAIAVARQRWLQQDIASPESISKELMTNAVSLARNRGLLVPGGTDGSTYGRTDDDVVAARRAFAAELADVVRRVAVVREMSLRHLREGVLRGDDVTEPPGQDGVPR